MNITEVVLMLLFEDTNFFERCVAVSEHQKNKDILHLLG